MGIERPFKHVCSVMEEANDYSANWNAGCKDQCDKRCNRVEEEVMNSSWGTWEGFMGICIYAAP